MSSFSPWSLSLTSPWSSSLTSPWSSFSWAYSGTGFTPTHAGSFACSASSQLPLTSSAPVEAGDVVVEVDGVGALEPSASATTPIHAVRPNAARTAISRSALRIGTLLSKSVSVSTLGNLQLPPEHRAAKSQVKDPIGQSSPCSPEPDPEPPESSEPLPELSEPEPPESSEPLPEFSDPDPS